MDQEELRFGDRAETLLLALHGAGQSVEDTRLEYLGWREMCGLEALANDRTVVIMPQAPRRLWSLYSERDLRRLRAIIEREAPGRVFAAGFSMGATFLTMAARHIPFAGVVLCSGVLPPFHRPERLPPLLPMRSLVWAAEEERNRAQAQAIHQLFAEVGPAQLDFYPGGRRWPAAWNDRVAAFLEEGLLV